MERIVPMTSVQQWEEAYAASLHRPLFIFKHSTSCSISSGALDELLNWIEDAGGIFLDVVLVNVIENRVVSDLISEQLAIKHESPQVILLENRTVIWHASHWSITYSTLDDHLRTHCEK
ncbi:general stress protein [Paenibacillus baekrokdamisoli]|uniref:General stress protein n=1 Tax=Paenibacillus baekrokdamisoli TaxID=1712516 RepID=A0A3G9J739_9BACL|nr:bacillithiol system redox-active protein YtxJ [Paenibacillus baekrokdamisoli]MBB3067200.1 bacillithiol system protein YtxJ [Paenibacillus baekrokdamisoli]BBH19608.1 general stress protein [Paenibacillus baekrokdamisoli]